MTSLTCQIQRHPLLAWLARGAIGIALLVLAASTRELFVIVPAIVAALLAFGGCPMCWTLGVFERSYQMFKPIAGERQSWAVPSSNA